MGSRFLHAGGLLLLAFVSQLAQASTVVLSPSNRGFFTDNTGYTSLAGQGQLGDFIVGTTKTTDPNDTTVGTFRNFFVFDIPQINGVVTGAELQLQEPQPTDQGPGGYLSLDPTETYELHSISDSVAAINAARAYNPVIFNDILDGMIYGRVVVKKTDKTVTVPLSAVFTGLIESSQGKSIAAGGVLTSISSRPISTEQIFAATANVAFSTLTIFVQDPPKVTAGAPQPITSTTARLQATVNPNGLATKVTFAVDGVTLPGSVAVRAGTADVPISFNATGLSPDTDHQVSVTGISMNGTLTSTDGPVMFHTAKAPPAPAPVVLAGGGTAASGAAAPGAGVFPGVPSGATLAQFGLPAIDASGALAFRAVLAGRPALSMIVGPTAPATVGALAVTGGTLPGQSTLTYVTLSDPVVGGPASGATGAGAFGRVAFTAKVRGTGVNALNNTALLSTGTADGSLEVLARTGSPLLGHTLAAVLSDAVDGDGNPCAVVRFAYGGGINASNSVAFVQWVSGTPSVIVQMGDPITVNTVAKVVASIAALQPARGSVGAARGPVTLGGSLPVCRVTFTKDGTQAIVRGEAKVEAATGDQPPFGTGTFFQSFGNPAGGPTAAFSATLKLEGGVRSGQNGVLVFAESNGTRLTLHFGDYAPGLGVAVKMSTYTQPAGGEDAGIACIAALFGTGVSAANGQAVLWVDGGGFRRLAARTGGPAPGILSATLASFASVALPPGQNNGPIFTGTLAIGGAVNAANNQVLWCAYPVNGGEFVVTDKLLRTGDIISIGGNLVTVTSLSVLQGAAGSLAQGRCYNASGQIAVLVGYNLNGVRQQAPLVLQFP